MADCKKWGDDTAGAQEEKHTYGKWNLMVSGDEMGKKGNTREEPTVARVQCFHSFCSLPLLLTRLWVEEWKSFVFMTDDTVGEQLADCLPHFYQVIFSIGEEVKKKPTEHSSLLCSLPELGITLLYETNCMSAGGRGE